MEKVEGLLEALDNHLGSQPGYILGFRFASLEGGDQVGRVSVWASREAANHAAGLTHTVALRSEIHLFIQPGHVEDLFEIVGSKNLPGV